MEESMDIIQRLGEDISLKILVSIKDPSDLVRSSFVSRFWRRLVISNSLCKNLCLRLFPEVSRFTSTTAAKNMVAPGVVESEDSGEWAHLQREHKVYASLSIRLTSFTEENCISHALFASSTDNYPEESLWNTLPPIDGIENCASYWSSTGSDNPAAAETLIYTLSSRLCLVTEIHICPFQAYFQLGHPIYSAKAVRFWLGHPKVLYVDDADIDPEIEYANFDDCINHKFEWKYCSPVFRMAQDNYVQKFKLPKPVLCIGGILKIELLGRVQAKDVNGLYYICINQVQVIGRPLYPKVFDVEMIDKQGNSWMLKYSPVNVKSVPPKLGEPGTSSQSHFQSFDEGISTGELMMVLPVWGAGRSIEDYDSDFFE